MVDKLNAALLDVIYKQLGRDTTTNIQLNKYGKLIFGDRYLGTFTADTIPDMPKDTLAIVNLDDSGGDGTHWVAVVRAKSGEHIVYDSFGRKTKDILPSMYGKGRRVVATEDDPEQKEAESDCGARCIAALMMYDLYGKNTLLKL